MISVNNADHFHFSYIRYIENKIREFFGFEGTPIEIELKSRKSMFKSKEKGGAYEDYFEKHKQRNEAIPERFDTDEYAEYDEE